MKYYVVADVHGFYTELQNALREKGFFEDKTPHKLVICGDLFDRGEEAKELQRFILGLMIKDEIILIRGNHEDLALDLLHRAYTYLYDFETATTSHHFHNGTIQTFEQLTGQSLDLAIADPYSFAYYGLKTPFVDKIIPAMQDFYETDKYIFVHGWIPCKASGYGGSSFTFSYEPDWRNGKEEDWHFARWYNGMAAYAQGVIEKGKTIVCGHWHASYGHSQIEKKCSEFGADADFTPFVADGIIALDACTVRSGFVNCVVLED